MALREVQFKDGSTEVVDAPDDASKLELAFLVNKKRAVEKRERFLEEAKREGDIRREQERLRDEERVAYQSSLIPTRETGVFEDLTSGFGAGVVGMGEMAALGIASVLEEESELEARDKIKAIASDWRPEGGDPDTVTYGLGQALGSIVGLAAPVVGIRALPALGVGTAATAGKAALLTGLGLAGSAGAGEASERAREEGATEDDRNTARNWGTIIGFSEMLPLFRFIPFDKVPYVAKLTEVIGPKNVNGWGERVLSGFKTAGAEGAQEASAEFFQNLVERGYNLEQDLGEGLLPAAGYGGGAGAIIQVVTDLFVKGRPRGGGIDVNKRSIDDILRDPQSAEGLNQGSLKMAENVLNGRPAEEGIVFDAFGNPQWEGTTEEVFDDAAETETATAPKAAGGVDYKTGKTLAIETADVKTTMRDWQTGDWRELQKEPLTPEAQQQGMEDDARLWEEAQARRAETEAGEVPTTTGALAGETIVEGEGEVVDTATETVVEEAPTTAPVTTETELEALRTERSELEILNAKPITQENRDEITGATARLDEIKNRINELEVLQRAANADALQKAAPKEDAPKEDEAGIKDRAKVGPSMTVAEMEESFGRKMETLIPSNMDELSEKDQEYWKAEYWKAAQEFGIDDAPLEGYTTVEEFINNNTPEAILKKKEELEAQQKIATGLIGPGKKRKQKAEATKRGISTGELEKELSEEYNALQTDINALGKAHTEGRGATAKGDVGRGATQTGDVEAEVKDEGKVKKVVKTTKPKKPAPNKWLTRVQKGTDPRDNIQDVVDDFIADAESEADPAAKRGKEYIKKSQANYTEEDVGLFEMAIADLEGQILKPKDKKEAIKVTAEAEGIPDNVAQKQIAADQKEIRKRLKELKSKIAPAQRRLKTEFEPTGDAVRDAETLLEIERKRIAEGEVETQTVVVGDSAGTEKVVTSKEEQTAIQRLNTAFKEWYDSVQDEVYRRFASSKNIGIKESNAPFTEQDVQTLIKFIAAGPPTMVNGVVLAATETNFPKQKNETDAAYKKRIEDLKEAVSAYRYLTLHPRPQDSLLVLAYDDAIFVDEYGNPIKRPGFQNSTEDPKSEVEVAYLKQTGGKFTELAMGWVNKNLSGAITAKSGWIDRVRTFYESLPPPLSADAFTSNRQPLKIDSPWLKDNPTQASNSENTVNFELHNPLESDGSFMHDNTFLAKAYKNIGEGTVTREEVFGTKLERDTQKGRERQVGMSGWERQRMIPKDSPLNLDIPIHPQVVALLRKNDLSEALRILSFTNPSVRVRELAKAFAENVGTTKLETVKGLMSDRGTPANGLFDPKTNTIKLDADTGMNTHTLLHEMSHAVTSATLANPNSFAAKQLKNLFESIQDQLGTAYGSTSLEEFVAEYHGNASFVKDLAQITVPNTFITALHKVRNIIGNIIRRLIGKKPIPFNAATHSDYLIHALLYPAPATRFAGELFMAMNEGVLQETVRGWGKAVSKAAQSVDDKVFQDGVDDLFGLGKKGVKAVGAGFLNSQALADVFKLVLGAQAGKDAYYIHTLFEKQGGDINDINTLLDGTAKKIELWMGKNPELKETFDNMVSKSTIEQVDPSHTRKEAQSKYKGVNAKKFKIWEGMQEDWKALKRTGGDAEYIRLRNTYKLMFTRLKDALSKRIDEATKETTDKEAVKRLKNEMFEKLFNEANIEPYFPLTRVGDHWLRFVAIPTDKNGKQIGPEELVVEAFGSKAARTRRLVELSEISPEKDGAKIKKDSIRDFGKLDSLTYDQIPSTTFVGNMLKVLKQNGVDEEVSLQIARNFIDAVPESSFLKNLHKREGYAGYQNDAMEAFKLKAYSIGRQIENIKITQELNGAKDDLQQTIDKQLALISEVSLQLDAARATQDREKIESLEKQMVDLVGTKYFSLENSQLLMDEISARIKNATSSDNDPVEATFKNANRLAFLGTIGFSVASALVNMGQVPMVVLPFLAGKLGLGATKSLSVAWDSVAQAGRLFGGSGISRELPAVGVKQVQGKDGVFESDSVEVNAMPSIDNFYVPDIDGQLRLREGIEDVADFYQMPMEIDEKTGQITRTKSLSKLQFLEYLRPFIQKADDRSLLNRTLTQETLGNDLSGKRKTSRIKNAWDKFNIWSAFGFHSAERMNRQVSLVACYLNEVARMNLNPNIAKGEQNLSQAQIFETAIEPALYDTQQTNGGSTLSTSPRWAQKNVGRVAMMFKTYGFTMYYHQAKMAAIALQQAKENGLDDYSIKQARRQFVASLGTTALMSGLQGLTIVGIVEGMLNLWQDDDEEDGETLIRQYLGEPLYSGGIQYLTAFAGDIFNSDTEVDIASRIGLSHLVLGSNKYDFNESAKEELVNILGGPALSYLSSIGRGVTDIYNGEIQRGVESMVPSAFRNILKATRYSDFDEGTARTRRGDPIVDDLNPVQIMSQALGFAPAEYARAQEINQDLKRIDRTVNTKRTKLMKQYYIAFRMHDWAQLDNIKDEIAEFNKRHRRSPKVVISEESIKKSMKMHMKTTETMYNGVTLSPNMRDTLLEIARAYERGPAF